MLPAAAFVFLLFVALISPADAVPSYARQTGQECIACHVSFPELTPYGRYFQADRLHHRQDVLLVGRNELFAAGGNGAGVGYQYAE